MPLRRSRLSVELWATPWYPEDYSTAEAKRALRREADALAKTRGTAHRLLDETFAVDDVTMEHIGTDNERFVKRGYRRKVFWCDVEWEEA